MIIQLPNILNVGGSFYSIYCKIVPYFNLPQEILLTEKRTTLEKRGYLVLDNTPKEILEFTRGQMKSSFSDVIKPNTKEFVYGGPSGIDKKWFKKNKDLFYKNN